MPDAATMTPVCRKCGAIASRENGDKLCAACLLEVALTNDSGELAPTPVLMDFGDYELVEELGRGGQGVVYRARQKGLNRIVALKIIGLGHWATEAHLKRFRMEAEAAAQLDHPAIVPIYEIGERDGACFFSMKFIEGGQLDELVRQKPVSIRQAAELVAKIARTVHYAHENGVLHRDIKPGNILLDRAGEPHLTDFGLARLVEKESNVTRTMDVLGTPSYMAPEQAAGRNEGLTKAADVYGLGAVLYHLLTGQPPFAGGTTYDTIKLVLETEPRSPRLWNTKVDRDLATVCLKCLEKEPSKRYQTAEAFAEDLEHWLRHEPVRARPTNVFLRIRKWMRRNPATAALVPSLVALAVALGVMFWTIDLGSPPTGIAVLPFDNLGDDQRDTSFADGIQDDILTKLGNIADLRVISRTSVMQYRGVRDVRRIGQALRVSHVLEGSVRRADGRIRINAQLIDARNDRHLWAEEYNRKLTDVFAIQSELAEKIAEHLSVNISTGEKRSIRQAPTQDLAAYELYSRARELNRISSSDDPETLARLGQASGLLEQALTRDPHFALAYCLLADVDLMLYWMPGRVDAARRARAEEAVHAAQRLSPDSGETHVAAARFYHYGERDLNHALEQLDIAARLLPNSPDVFDLSAKIERRLGRWNEALRHFAKANELDPRNPSALNNIVVTDAFLRRYDESNKIAEQAIDAFPEAASDFWQFRADNAVAQGDFARAQAATERIAPSAALSWPRYFTSYYQRDYDAAERLCVNAWQKDSNWIRYYACPAALAARARGDLAKMREYFLLARTANESTPQTQSDPGTLADLAVIDAGLGNKQLAIEEGTKAVELRPISSDAIEGPEYVEKLARAYALLGEREQALEQLWVIAKVPNGAAYGNLKFDPVWNDLRDDPRFEKLLDEAAKPLL